MMKRQARGCGNMQQRRCLRLPVTSKVSNQEEQHAMFKLHEGPAVESNLVVFLQDCALKGEG